MINSLVENQIKEFGLNKIINKREILSEAFNIRCEKISFNTNEAVVAKYYLTKKNIFNSIESETNSLNYLYKKFSNLFPSVKYASKDLLIINFIENNNIKKDNYQKILAEKVTEIHNIKNSKYGFDFDAQIGGLRQPNDYSNNWVDFFREKRLNMIFEIINKTNPMPNKINIRIEKLLNNLHNYIPKKPSIRLLHGDLWSGNILFNNGELVGLIDPGIYFGHNEMEISYLTWFKLVDINFLNHYSNIINIDKHFSKYEPIYQLYFCLLNVHLWSRDYVKNTNDLLEKIFHTHGLGSDK